MIARLLCPYYIDFDTSRFCPMHGINIVLQTPCPLRRERFIYRRRALSRLYFAFALAQRFCPMHGIKFNQYLSTNSLPNVQGEVYPTLSLPCPQPVESRPFTRPSVLSNACDQYLSKNSLPNELGEVYLSLPCPQSALSLPCMCPSAKRITSS
jgi:hypothetical protein